MTICAQRSVFNAMVAGIGVALISTSLGAQAIPTPDSLLRRAEAAIGGRAALDKHTSVRITGTVAIPDADIKGTVEILRAKPDRFVQSMNLSGMGTIRKGYDSTVAWVVEPTGPTLFTGSDADAMAVQASWYNQLLVPAALTKARVDSAEFDGEPAWKLTYASDLGLEVFVYLSRTTGLRMAETTTTTGGETTTVESDYREFGGVKFPMKVVTRSPAGELVYTFETVEFDHVDPKSLGIPPEIRALIKPGRGG